MRKIIYRLNLKTVSHYNVTIRASSPEAAIEQAKQSYADSEVLDCIESDEQDYLVEFSKPPGGRFVIAKSEKDARAKAKECLNFGEKIIKVRKVSK